MKGLELCRRYYAEFGAPMLAAQFPEVLAHVAVGLLGPGSECLGFDDELSRDHDFEPGFCIILPGEDIIDRRTEFALSRAYAKLPREFLGFARSPLSPVGGNRHGPIRREELLLRTTGTPDGALSLRDWLHLPEQSLLELTGGELWQDGDGVLSSLRTALSRPPEDVRRKKLAGELLLMGQSGQYNHPRCTARKDAGAAALAAAEFAKSALHAAHLLEGRYMPYYKWSFRSLHGLPRLSSLSEPLEALLCGSMDAEGRQALIESVCESIISALRTDGLSARPERECEAHAYAVNDGIRDANLRTSHILAGV